MTFIKWKWPLERENDITEVKIVAKDLPEQENKKIEAEAEEQKEEEKHDQISQNPDLNKQQNQDKEMTM